MIEKLLTKFGNMKDLNYITFKNLGDNFGVSEATANKTYHYILDIIVQVLHVPGSKSLLDTDIDTVVVNVTEQQIERPVKKQGQYYSGKKNDIP